MNSRDLIRLPFVVALGILVCAIPQDGRADDEFFSFDTPVMSETAEDYEATPADYEYDAAAAEEPSSDYDWAASEDWVVDDLVTAEAESSGVEAELADLLAYIHQEYAPEMSADEFQFTALQAYDEYLAAGGTPPDSSPGQGGSGSGGLGWLHDILVLLLTGTTYSEETPAQTVDMTQGELP